jgi:Mg2+ and Co2+ transporter CorA
VIFYLTIITTVTSFPNTIATFFGISQFGSTHYAIILAAILASTVLPFAWLWRKKWLNARTALRQIDEEQE